VQNLRDYDISELGEKKRVIPGPEPKLNRDGQVIQVCTPDITEKEIDYVTQAVKSGWISSRGEFLDRFEKLFAENVGAKYAVAVNSGTSALHLALSALGIGPGDEVIVPTATMVSTAFAVSYLGATPVFVDCDEYYQMDVSKIEETITPRTKAILPVHIYGHPCDCDRIEDFGCPVIYDAAESHGAEYNGKPIGGRGLASCYSFYGNKIVTTGEGGMIVTNDEEFAKVARNLKDVAFSTVRHFWHTRLGYNFRMTNLQAAVGLAQTERFEELVKKHIDHAEYYMKGLEGLPLRMPKTADWAKNVYWMFGFEVLPEFGMTRDELRTYMADKGIETRTFFVPMHLQPYYYKHHDNTVWNESEFPIGSQPNFKISERLCERGMYIPSSSTLTIEQMDYVINTIKDAFHTGK
jgi:perosamine synthetase